jgi:hypothetical protein
MAHSAGGVLRADKEPHGVEQHFAFLNDPVIVKSLCLKKPERIAALGVVFLLALLLWRLVERARRVHGETTGSTVTGWDKQETQKPTACMMMAKFAAVLVRKGGPRRQLAQPFSAVQQAYLRALGVLATSWTLAPYGEGNEESAGPQKTHRDGAREGEVVWVRGRGEAGPLLSAASTRWLLSGEPTCTPV